MKKILSFLILLLFILANQSFAKVPPPPNLIYPPCNGTNIPTVLTFDWSDMPSATLYAMRVYDDAFNIVSYHTNLNVSQFYSSGELSQNTHYNWQARAVNGPDTNWSAFCGFTTTISAPSPPTLVYPPNDTTNMPVTVLTFIWNPSSGAQSYHLQISTDPNFNTMTFNIPGLTTTQWTITPPTQLAYGTMYYWRVNATNTGGTSGWSTVWHFATIPAPPSPPTLISPPNHATNVGLTPLMDWSDVSGVDGYQLQIATDPGFVNVILEVTTFPSTYQVQSGTLSGNTHYYWHVRSHNVGGYGPWAAYFDFTTMPAPPARPILVAPPNGATCQLRNPTFSWNSVPTATSYLLQVGTDSTFNSGVIIAVTISAISYTPPANALNVNTLYYWRVRAYNSSGSGDFSDVWHLTTVPPLPAVPTLSYPCSQSGMPLTFTFRWNRSAGAVNYEIQVSPNSSFTTTIVSQANIVDSFYTIPTGLLQGGATYYWHVRAWNCAGNSAYSNNCNFTTMTTLSANIKVFLEGFYSSSAQTQVQDTIDVILANSTSPWAFRDSSMIYLSTGGTGVCSFGYAPSGSYYIVVRHRNHLETWSSLPVIFTPGNPVNYDFTTASNKAYGNNMKQVGSVWVFYAGDINQDGQILAEDYTMMVSQFGKDGYIGSDLNGDNFVDGYDLPILYSNFFKTKART